MGLALLAPAPVAFAMWVEAFQPFGAGITVFNAFTAVIVIASLVASVVAFSTGLGARFELGGSRYGLVIAVIGFLSYLFGTSTGSGLLHAFGVSAFYCGCVLFLAGAKAAASTFPSGLVVILSAAPTAYGLWGLVFLDGTAWALVVTAAALLIDSRKFAKPPGCSYCPSSMGKGEGFCASCGRLVAPLAGPSLHRIAALCIFSVLMLAVLFTSVPVIIATPTVSLISYGLGGPNFGNLFAPLSGWGAKASTLSVNGTQVEEYTLTEGGASIKAFATTSQDVQAAVSALNGTRSGPVAGVALPAAINQSMAGYAFEVKGTSYTDIQGAFPVSMLNGSSIMSAIVAVDLRQTTMSFQADHGSVLYSAASSVKAWASTSSLLTNTLEQIGSSFQWFTQAVYAFSLASVGVALFTLARDDEMAKTRRIEALHGLNGSEVSALEAFGTGNKPMTGRELREASLRSGSLEPETAFYSSLEELARRGLVSKSVEIKNRAPVMSWRRLV